MEAPPRSEWEAKGKIEDGDALVRDAFLLFNSRQPGIALINAALHEHGITTWYSPHEAEISEDWDAREAAALQRARTLVVLLGDHGWGPVHRMLTQESAARMSRILLVLIGEVQPAALEGLDDSVAALHPLRFKTVDDREAMQTLVREIRAALPTKGLRTQSGPLPAAANQRALLQRLMDGDEDSQAEALDELADLAERFDFAELEDEIVQAMTTLGPRSQWDPEGRLRATLAAALFTCSTQRDRRGEEWRPGTPDLIAHFTSPRESGATVRFAALAAAVRAQANVDRLDRDDPDPGIRVLIESARARQIGSALEDPVPGLLRGVSRTQRAIALRVLTVVPNGALAPTISDQMLEHKEAFAHENTLALWALTEPSIAAHAVHALATSPTRIVPIARICADAGRYLFERTVRLLHHLDRAVLDEGLASAQGQGFDFARGAERLLERLGRASRRYVAGYVPEVTDVSEDLELSHDRLDIALDVKTLSAVILSTDVKPPLSIGLFGNWGTGKTFFMDCMQAEITRLSRETQGAKERRFHARVAQIRFNAWHYIDANLWASLVSHIIEELSKKVQPVGDPLVERNHLVVQLQTAQELKKDAEHEMVRATETRTNVERELHQVSADRAREQVALHNLRAIDLWRVVRDDDALAKKLDAASDALGMPRALASVQELDAAVRDVHQLGSRVYALARTVTRSPGLLGLLILIALGTIGAPALLWLLGKWPSHLPVLPAASAFIAELTAGATLLAALLRGPRKLVNQALEQLELAHRRAHELLEEKRNARSKQEIELEKKIEELGAKVASATQQFAAAEAKVREIEAKINEIDDGRSLSKYLLQRFQTEDYRRHLGLVSTIRRDFEKLSELLEIAAKESRTEPIQRIVLYVDDLDRCPAPRVMEVLQAVHLLLAFELFVVVVGVDPRWLLHSLERSYSAFRRGGGGKLGRRWVTTPQNYLEKIFQIPFSLRPMGEEGFGKLLGALLSDTQSAGSPAVDVAVTAVDADANEGRATTSTSTSTSAPTPPAGTRSAAAHTKGTPPPPPAPPPPAPQLNYDALRIRPWERAYAARLHAFMPSPRAAKRFANVYRLLKAPLDHDELRRFEGTVDAPGEFRIAMLLLAISTGFASSAPALFTSLLETSQPPPEPGAWLDTLERADSPIADAPRLCRSLRPLVAEGIAPTTAPFAAWAQRVRRYSFDSPNEGTG